MGASQFSGKGLNRRQFIQSTATIAGAGLGAMILTSPAGALGAAVPPSDRVTLGLIGVGARVHQIIDALLLIPGVEIVKVCDAYDGRITRAIERAGGRPVKVGSYKEILADKGIDAVVIGTPDHWHARMAIEAVGAGKDVYIEKPLTYTVDEGLEIIKAVKSSGRVLQVGSQGISTPTQRKAREVIKSGKLGQITMIRAYYNRNTASGAWIYPIPPDANDKTVRWNDFLGSAPKVPFSLERFFRWRCYKDYSGGIPTDLFVHLCPTIHFLMGVQAPARVMAMGKLYRWKESRDVPDTVNACLLYNEGFMVNMSSTFNNQTVGGQGFQILGTDGALVVAEDLTFIPDKPRENNDWIVRAWPSPLEKAYYKDPKIIASELTPVDPKERASQKIDAGQWKQTYDQFHLEKFIDCVKNKTKPEEDAEVGHRAAAVAHMVNRSINTGQTVEWDFQAQRIKA